MIPFAVVGSERSVIIDGKSVRGRKTRWGVVNVEDEKHCEFVYLRNFLTRSVSSIHSVIPLSQNIPPGHTCRISSRRLHRSTTRRSARSSCSLSRSRPTVLRPRKRFVTPCFSSVTQNPDTPWMSLSVPLVFHWMSLQLAVGRTICCLFLPLLLTVHVCVVRSFFSNTMTFAR